MQGELELSIDVGLDTGAIKLRVACVNSRVHPSWRKTTQA